MHLSGMGISKRRVSGDVACATMSLTIHPCLGSGLIRLSMSVSRRASAHRTEIPINDTYALPPFVPAQWGRPIVTAHRLGPWPCPGLAIVIAIGGAIVRARSAA